MVDNLDQRLDDALGRRDDLEANKQRLVGNLESAQKALEDIRQECRDKGVDPDKLDDTLAQLQKRYEEMVQKLEKGVAEATTKLSPYLNEEA